MHSIRPLNFLNKPLVRRLRPSSARRAAHGQPSATLRPKRRHYSTSPKPSSSTPASPTPTAVKTTTETGTDASRAAAETRLDRLLSRLPRPLQRYTARLRGAPVTHVVAFLILHELTAVVPLFGLFGLFHYTELAPVSSLAPWVAERYGASVKEGVGRFERYFTRKGWFGFGETSSSPSPSSPSSKIETAREELEGLSKAETEASLERWEADPKYRVLVEIGLAYALTKVLLPVRIVGSVWATPWFAGVLGRVKKFVRGR
ncbi:hypothetical protein VTI28DRAFT_10625 [Corynascus sepedonium]